MQHDPKHKKKTGIKFWKYPTKVLSNRFLSWRVENDEFFYMKSVFREIVIENSRYFSVY
jgi:hypothetical protein